MSSATHTYFIAESAREDSMDNQEDIVVHVPRSTYDKIITALEGRALFTTYTASAGEVVHWGLIFFVTENLKIIFEADE